MGKAFSQTRVIENRLIRNRLMSSFSLQSYNMGQNAWLLKAVTSGSLSRAEVDSAALCTYCVPATVYLFHSRATARRAIPTARLGKRSHEGPHV